jgi:arsenate reductase-like glutaredoxin family protein
MKEFSKSRLQREALQEKQQKAARERRLRRARLTPADAAKDVLSTEAEAAEILKDPLSLIRREIAVMKKLECVLIF